MKDFNTIQFIGINPADLIKGIQTALIPQLKAELSQEFQPKQPTEYLTRAEVVEIILDVEEMDLEDIEIEEIPHARTAEYKNVSNRYRYNTRKLKILIIMYVF